MRKLTHVDQTGKADMVDVSAKTDNLRTAEAYCEVIVSEKLFDLIKENKLEKGDVLTVAKIAGIQAAKKTSELIPLCHNIFITKVDVNLILDEKTKSIKIKSFAKTVSKTGIELEALTAVSIAALTIYDMCKAVEKTIKIKDIHLLSKTGGKSGNYTFYEETK